MPSHTYLNIWRLALSCLPVLARASSPAPSPQADTELICSTHDPTDCYPRLFQPTKDFQVIREGQDIPPALHVRLDVYDGKREARLNIPMEGEEGESTAPMEQAVVMVDQPEQESVEEAVASPEPKLSQIPPAYEAAGKIQLPSEGSTDFSIFQAAIVAIKDETPGFDTALDDLSELSHDVYFGVEIAKQHAILEQLVCVMARSNQTKYPGHEQNREHKAASILAAAIQNNLSASNEVPWTSIVYPSCGPRVAKDPENPVSRMSNILQAERDPVVTKAKVAALSGFLRQKRLRDELLASGVMKFLLEVFLKDEQGWDAVRKRIAQLVMDVFLDEEMDAEFGVWPKGQVKDAVCGGNEGRLDVGCWEYHVREFGKTSKQPWVKDFIKAFEMQRAQFHPTLPGKEL